MAEYSTFLYLIIKFFALFGVKITGASFTSKVYFTGMFFYYYLPTLIGFLFSLPMNFIIIYRLARREAVMNNFQKAIIFQCVVMILMTSSDQAVKICNSNYFTELKYSFEGMVYTFRDIELCAICGFAIYWKNIFAKHRIFEISSYIFLSLTFAYRTWGNIMIFLRQYYSDLWLHLWTWELDHFNRVYQVVPIIFPLGVLIISFACFLTLMTIKTKAYSDHVLKEIRKMSLVIFLKCLFVIPVLANMIWFYFPFYFPSTREFFDSYEFTHIGIVINRYCWIVTSLYPVFHSILTWYSIDGLLKHHKKSNQS